MTQGCGVGVVEPESWSRRILGGVAVGKLLKLESVKNLQTMKLSQEQMQYILKPGVKMLAEMFKKNGFEIRVAGGAVRDLLMDLVPTDLDFATTATPEEMKEIFTKEEVRILPKGGEKHGTVVTRIEDENFDCTTLRIDKVTDGRHAKVEYTRDWKLDAARRDLTINAMFLGLDGTIYDYFNGIDHIRERIVTFVGDPNQRIQEDYLRILRYFRFFGRVASDPLKHNNADIEAIRRNYEGLAKIAGERLWVEIKKIVVGRFGGELITKMVECGVGIPLGLSQDFKCQNVECVYKRIENADIVISDVHPCSLLAAGFICEEDALFFTKRVKCSNKEKDVLLFIIQHRHKHSGPDYIKILQDLLVDLIYKEKKPKPLALMLVTQLTMYEGRKDLLPQINDDLIPVFPINGKMLLGKVKQKNKMTPEIFRLLDLWKRSNYTLGSEELIKEIKSK